MTPIELHAKVHATVTAQLTESRNRLFWAQQTRVELADPKLLGKQIPGWGDWPAVERLAEWAIRACEADLLRLERHKPVTNVLTYWASCPCTHGKACPELGLMAHVYGIEIDQ